MPLPYSKSDIALWFIAHEIWITWKCQKCGIKRNQKKAAGYENVYSYIEKKQPGFAKEISSGTNSVNFEIPPDVINLGGWLELIVVTNQLFTIVENGVYAKFTKLKYGSRPTIIKYLDLITARLEKGSRKCYLQKLVSLMMVGLKVEQQRIVYRFLMHFQKNEV